MRRLSALLMAGVMSLGSGAMASAANMSIYVREYNSVTDLVTPKFNSLPAAVVTTQDGDTVYSAIARGTTTVGTIKSDWTEAKNTDGTIDMYLKEFTAVNGTNFYSAANDGKNINPIYEGGTMTGATWSGDSWMWFEGSDLGNKTYPNETMSDVKCPSGDFAIVLSYDHSEFKWGSALK